MECNNTVTKNA